MYKVGDVVRYVGNDVAKKRSDGIMSFWAPPSCLDGTIGIVEYIHDTGKNDVERYSIRVTREILSYIHHIEEMFYEFELEKV